MGKSNPNKVMPPPRKELLEIISKKKKHLPNRKPNLFSCYELLSTKDLCLCTISLFFIGIIDSPSPHVSTNVDTEFF